jgi:GT2 family glycosyltransferase/glycosyltransferase involved in cell wall biosynthesis
VVATDPHAGATLKAGAKRSECLFRITILSLATSMRSEAEGILQIAQLLHLRGHQLTLVSPFGNRELERLKLDAPFRKIHFDERSSLKDLEEHLPPADILLTSGHTPAISLLNSVSRRKGIKYLLFTQMGVDDRALYEAAVALPSFHKLSTAISIAEKLGRAGVKVFAIDSDCIDRLEQVFLSTAREENPTVIAQPRWTMTIGILIHNQPDYVQNCLRSIRENTRSDFELILVDDQSDAETRALLREASQADPDRVRYIRNEPRKSFPYNFNRIVSNSCGRYICLLNADTFVTRGWDLHLIDALKVLPDLAVTGPSTSYGIAKSHGKIVQQLAETHGRRFEMNGEEIQSFAAMLRDREAGKIEESEDLDRFCMMLNSEIIPNVGFMDEKFGPGSRAKAEFIDRVRRAGYRCGWVKSAYVHHYGTTSACDLSDQVGQEFWEEPPQFYIKTVNQQKGVLVTDKRIAFLYTSKFASSTRKRTFEIARKLQRYLDVETFHVAAAGEDVFRDFDIFILQRLGGLNEQVSPQILDRTMTWIGRYRPAGKLFLYDIDDFVFDGQHGTPRRLMGHSDGVIASTPHLQKLAESLNPRCLCLRNGLDYDRFLAAPRARLDPARFHVVCASLGAVGQTELSEIAERVKRRAPDTEMHLFRDTSYCRTLPHLTLHSNVGLDELFGYMKGADVVLNFDLPDDIYRKQLEQQYGVLPSQMNDFINAKSGLKYYNAAAAAKPLVSTPRPSCYSEIIQNGVNGFLAQSIDSFVDLILKLRADPALREKVGQRAFEDLLANYTLDQTVFDYLEAICYVLPEWQRPAQPLSPSQ